MDAHVAVGLRVEEGFFELVGAELFVLETRLVRADALDHELLVFFGPAFGAHGAVGEAKDDPDSPEEGEGTVCDEDGLPGPDGSRAGVLEVARVSDVGEGVCEETADDLLHAV